MTKQEFLSELREALEGNIPLDNVEENIRFYDNYFQESSRSEREVCEELGDPRLIARTIMDSFAASKGAMADYYTEQARSEFSREEKRHSGSEGTSGWHWYDRLTRILVMAAVLIVAAGIFILLLQVAVYIVLPVVAIVFVVKLLSELFRRY